ncbi:MAG: amino acid racemase [Deltaproteobacteria bacterium]|nr:amino acid racemase [Deltaproteobacteria bacterium]
MPGHIGIVACSAPGAALCYETICIEGSRRMGRYDHPEISLHSVSFAAYMRAVDAGDWESVADLLLGSVEKLAAIGADFAICPDNTIHQALPFLVPRSPIPWLHIADAVVAEAKRAGFTRLAVLGTRYLMEGPVYAEKLDAAGIERRVPRAEERETINRIIFDELVVNQVTERARAAVHDVIARLRADEGCDAVVLGCTELPLLVLAESSPLPTLDSTRLLARAAIELALGDARVAR